MLWEEGGTGVPRRTWAGSGATTPPQIIEFASSLGDFFFLVFFFFNLFSGVLGSLSSRAGVYFMSGPWKWIASQSGRGGKAFTLRHRYSSGLAFLRIFIGPLLSWQASTSSFI